MKLQSQPPSALTPCNSIDWLPLQDEPLVTCGPSDIFRTATELLGRLRAFPFTNPQWAFKGQAKASWRLEHSLERLQNATVQGNDQVRRTEQVLESAFRRSAHHYVSTPPAKDERVEWLALMRHHGAPSRLLDWTWSPYVAAFFAAVDVVPGGPPSAIWAINVTAIRESAVALFKGRHPEVPDPTDEELISEDFFPFVIPIEPPRSNERLTAQQGIFICPSTVSFSLELSLKHTLSHLSSNVPAIRKIVLEPSVHTGLMNELYRMNISEASLFPGLDGFARSLGTRARFEALADLEAPSKGPGD